MSGTTQYVVASASEVETLSDHAWPLEQWRGCYGFKFFGPDELGHLSGLIRHGTGSFEDFPELAFGRHAWVYAMPDDLVAAIAEADDGVLSRWATAWSERIAAAQLGHKTPDELLELLRNLRTLVAEAGASDRAIYLWHSLAA